MANPTCTTASLLETVPCFSPQVLSEQQRLALRVYFLANQLARIGGTNYLSALTTTLVSAANDIFERSTPLQLDQALTTIYYNSAVALGASVSSDIQTLMTNTVGLQSVDMTMLQKMELTLLCKLGVPKAYPQ
jgi:hypothetical protein